MSPGCVVTSGPAFTEGAGGGAVEPWHVPLPASVAVWPGMGMNFHAYVPSASVSLSTPLTPVIRTSLLAIGVPVARVATRS